MGSTVSGLKSQEVFAAGSCIELPRGEPCDFDATTPVCSITPMSACSPSPNGLGCFSVSQGSAKCILDNNLSAGASATSGKVPTPAQSKFNGSGCPGLTEPWRSDTERSDTEPASDGSGDAAKPALQSGPLSYSTARVVCAVFMVVTAVAVVNLSAASGIASVATTRATVEIPSEAPAMGFVWAAGWITAVSTGLGALPFWYSGDIKKFWLGTSNALACGMMAAASAGLLLEAVHVQEEHHMALLGGAWLRAIIGAVAGVLFIVGTKQVLDKYEDLKFDGFSHASASKMLLIMAVMTLHSLAEGVGIGVSFAGASGSQFGMFISSTLAIHNVPEGLAICLVLVPRGVGPLEASMWAIFSSLPQPLMAVPAYASVQAFLPFLPVGLGFAAGAMLYVALFELLPEALEDVSKSTALPTAVLAATAMGSAQYLLH